MFSVTIRQEPARRLIGLPHTGPYPEVGPVFERVAAAIGAAGLWPVTQGGAMVALSDPGSTPPAELQSFAGCVVADDTPCPEGLETFPLAAGRYAVLEMTGPYTRLAEAWGWLYGPWMTEAGERPAPAPAFEIYRYDPTDTPPEALRTDLYAPLA